MRRLRSYISAGMAVCAAAVLMVTPSYAAESPADSPPSSPSLWERDALLRFEGGPRNWLERHGIRFDLWLTQFLQGDVAGDGNHAGEYGGRGDVFLTTDLAKLGLWKGLSLTVHGEGIYGDDKNFAGDGSILPINTAMAFPRLVGRDFDLSSVHFTQVFPKGVGLMLGKIDMLDLASKTPLIGGGGLSGFQNLAFSAPPSGLVPPAILGGLLSVPIAPVKLTLGLYDPANVMANDRLLEDAFEDGVTGMVSLTLPLQIAGRTGYHSISVKANNKVGVNIEDLGGLLLPPESEDVLGEEKGAWNATYSFQQYLVGAPGAADGGWGIFGQIGSSDGNPTPFDWFGFVGLGGEGLIPGRRRDTFGAGFFYLSFSDDLLQGLDVLAESLNKPALRLDDEMGGEIFYEAALTGWFHLTFDLQVIDPGVRRADAAVFCGLRGRLAF